MRYNSPSFTSQYPDGSFDPTFVPHLQYKKYPKPIKNNIGSKTSNLKRVIQTLKTPLKKSHKKEIHRFSELAKMQKEEFDKMVSNSISKKKQLSIKPLEV